LEHRAERAVIRIPQALLGVIIVIVTQGGYIIWRDGVQTERADAARNAMVDTKSQINAIAGKVDSLFQTRLTSRDIENVTSLIADHEARIRQLERARGNP